MTATEPDRHEECFEAAVSGRPLSADCAERLTADPDLADQVAVARWLNAQPGAALSPAARQRHRAQLQAYLRQRPQPRSWAVWFSLPARRWTAVGALCAGVAVFCLASAAQASLPGQALYPVKRSVEAVRLTLAADDVARGYLHLDYANERLTEARALQAIGRPAEAALAIYAEELRAATAIAQGAASPAGEALAAEINAVITDGEPALTALHLEADAATQAAIERAQAAATQALDITQGMLALETEAPAATQTPTQTRAATRRPPSRTPAPSDTLVGVQPPTDTPGPADTPTQAGKSATKPTKTPNPATQKPSGHSGGGGGTPQTPPGNSGGGGGTPQTPPGHSGGGGGTPQTPPGHSSGGGGTPQTPPGHSGGGGSTPQTPPGHSGGTLPGGGRPSP